MTTTRMTWPSTGDKAFVLELKQRVNEYFEARGISRYADAAMVMKTLVLLGTFFGAYAALLIGRLEPWAMLGLVVLMAVALAGIGCNVVHDALHGSYARSPRVNRLLGLTSELLGIHGYQWKLRHNKAHHAYTNVDHVDPDVSLRILRLTSTSDWHAAHRFQSLYAWPIYASMTLFFAYLKDYANIAERQIGPYHDIRHPRGAIAGLVLGKLFLYGFTIVVPVLVLDLAWWQFLVGLLLFHLTTGVILGPAFMLAHIFEAAAHPVAGADGNFPDSWHVHQLRTTTDFARGNRLLAWYLGGLNYQVEHHLFPGICSIHYPAISSIVEGTARKHGLPFHATSSLHAALSSHQRTLSRLGRRPADKDPIA